MFPAFRLVPSTLPVSATTSPHHHHDALRHGLQAPLAATLALQHSDHPTLALARHLNAYEATQSQTKRHLAQSIYGIHAPLKQMMEEYMCMPNAVGVVGRKSLGLTRDILLGRELDWDWEDVYDGRDRVGVFEELGEHKHMEKQLWNDVI